MCLNCFLFEEELLSDVQLMRSIDSEDDIDEHNCSN